MTVEDGNTFFYFTKQAHECAIVIQYITGKSRIEKIKVIIAFHTDDAFRTRIQHNGTDVTLLNKIP